MTFIKPVKNPTKMSIKAIFVLAFISAFGIFLVPDITRAATFNERCSATGVVLCNGFDDENNDFGATANGWASGEPLPSYDSTTHASGAGSIKFTIPAQIENQNPAPSNPTGSFNAIISNGTAGFGPLNNGEIDPVYPLGNTMHVQFRQRFSMEMFNADMGGQGWHQILVTSTSGYFGDPTILGIRNDAFGNYPEFYSEPSPSFNQTLKQVPFAANQWMTFYLKITIGNWGQANSSAELWVAPEGQALKKVNEIAGLTLVENMLGGSILDPGLNQIILTAYNPTKDLAAIHADGYTWFDELIVSTQAIADTYTDNAPTVMLTAPGDGSEVSDTVVLAASPADDNGIAGVQFIIDGANFGSEIATEPYIANWDTSSVLNGSHTISATVRDTVGQTATSSITLIVTNTVSDTTNPSVSVTSPANGANVSGTLSITATATDNMGVAGVQFMVDGTNLGAEDISAPYLISWNTTTATDDSHVITAIARDAAGNTATATTVTVTINNGDTTNPTVTLTAPTIGSTVGGTVPVTATASDNVGIVGVTFKLDGTAIGTEDTSAPYSASWNTTMTLNGSHTLTAVTRDAAGNSTTSTGVTVTVSNDTTAPIISFTAPANAATVSGSSITITAEASDNVGVAGVQFRLNGTNLGAEDTSVPYSIIWDSSLTANGNHTLTVIARDAAGNTTTATRHITVSNNTDSEAPTVPSNPSATAAAASQINLSWNASTDNVGVTGYRIFRNGEQLTTVTSTSYNDTGLAAGTTYTYTISAYDAAGNTSSNSTSVQATTSTSGGGGGGNGGGGGSSGGSSGGNGGGSNNGGGNTSNNGNHNGKVKGTKLVTGRLVKYDGNPTVYVISEDKKHAITSFGVYQKHFQNRPIAAIPSSEQYPDGPIVRYGSGTLVKTADSPQIYLILGNDTKYAFTSMEEFSRFGYKQSQVRIVNQDDINSYPNSGLASLPYHTNGTFLKYKKDSTVYMMEDQIKRPVTSAEVFLYYSNCGDVTEVSDNFQYQTGDMVGFPEGVIIKGSSPEVYLVRNNERQAFTSLEKLQNFGYNTSQIRTVPDGDLKLLSPGKSIN